MKVKAFLPEDYDRLCAMQNRIINMTRALTFDEQRDFAQKMRLLLELAESLDMEFNQ